MKIICCTQEILELAEQGYIARVHLSHSEEELTVSVAWNSLLKLTHLVIKPLTNLLSLNIRV